MKHLRIAFVLIVLVIALAGCGGSSNVQQGSSVTVQPQTTQAAPTATKAATVPVVGKSYVVNSTWTATVNKASTSPGGEFVTPTAGHTFLIIDVTLKNTSTEVQHASGFLQWSLHDATGQKYTQTFVSGTTDPGGAMAPGSIIRGQLPYEVPQNIHTYTLQFNDFLSNDIAEWQVNL